MLEEITFRDTIALFQAIYLRCEEIQPRPWGVDGAMIELAKQVGDLAKHVMVAEDYYFSRENKERYATSKEHIADELGDVLCQLIRIADYYEIDFVEAYLRGRQAEDAFLKKRGV